ncbi:delta-aminolevulinic acid dehydratase [Bdellovibrio bacteriovorus]|uniref:Delta-aminolevulinic acid dehydratase n=1 Tax=Bdellovibrio bacteriovorus TaxID=959 RepID=A0A150WPC9_BDEBC|nr:porphobilinogen synthase [Bdellovibrio bacteriovorus]KYG66248.1 delta-aminolevulinic acid dehydratase [Bdellovibrio bacteriovorus]
MRITQRPRRNRATAALREMVAETDLRVSQLVLPLFLVSGKNERQGISSMPGIYRLSPDLILEEVAKAVSLGVKTFDLFPALPEAMKDQFGKESLNPQGLLPTTLRMIRDKFPDVTLISDVALDPYSSDGHDGVVRDGKIINDETVEILAKMSVVHAEAGADIVSPSDMMDGRVGAIREALDQSGFENTGILSYSAKYASSFYGPFREALDSAPKFGDKKTYQMDFRNAREALREIELDELEGADMVMVKPALSYLDIISLVKSHTNLPVAAYNVSGEYGLIKAGAKAGIIDETRAMVETLYSIRRAGADIIFTYFALQMAEWLRNNQK